MPSKRPLRPTIKTLVKDNFQGKKMPAIIAEFYDMLDSLSKPFSDFEPLENGFELLASLINESLVSNFVVIGQHGTGSLIAVWIVNVDKPLDKQPIVWIDSEGEPNGVIALNFLDLLTLLPYNTTHIINFLYYCLRRKNNKNQEGSDSKYNIKEYATILSQVQEQYHGAEEYLQWLAKNKLSIQPDPFTKIYEALCTAPDLQKWLDEHGV